MSELTDEAVRADLIEQVAALVARYPEGRSRSALLPLLHLVQSVDGYVSPEGIAFCAEQLGLTKAEVGAVATFYTMYKRRPTGEYLVSICTNTMCGVLGGDKAYEAVSEYLEVGHDQTTEDGLITFEHAECLAACDYAPVMTVNYEFYDQVDADMAVGLVKQLQEGQRPLPSRGARLCSFKEISRQLAGFADTRNGSVGDNVIGEPTVAGNRLAEQREVSVPGFNPNTPIGKKSETTDTPVKAAPPAKAAAKAPTKASTKAPTKAPAKAPSKAVPPAALIPAEPTEPAPAEVDPPTAATPASSGEIASVEPPPEKPAETEKPPRARRRSAGPLASATAEPGNRRPGNRAPARRGGTRRPTNRDPSTERAAPAVEQADAAPAEPATEPDRTAQNDPAGTATPTEPAETSPTIPPPAADSKPAGDASPTDPRAENDKSEGPE